MNMNILNNEKGQAVIPGLAVVFLLLLAFIAVLLGGVIILGKVLLYAGSGIFIGYIATFLGGLTDKFKPAKSFKVNKK